MNARRALSRLPAPDEAGAQARAWSVVRESYEAQPAAARRRSRIGLAISPAVAVLAVGLALSPAGASVRTAISHAFRDTPRPHRVPRLHVTGLALPAAGQLLLSGQAGTWTVGADGTKRYIGRWREASWSPRRKNIVVAGHGEVAAVTPSGRPEWIRWHPDVSDPRWYGPDGYRVAYLSGHELWVVAGDGTGDHLLAGHVERVAPAWRTGHPYEVAYSPRRGTVAVRQADTGALLWSRPAPGAVTNLEWSSDGRELVAVTRFGVRLYDPTGRTLETIALTPLATAALSPDGLTLALLRGGATQDVLLVRRHAVPRRVRTVFSAAGLRDLTWSPDGRWLMLDWPVADEWLFVRATGAPEILGVGAVGRQLGAGRALPGLDGWCCTADGGAAR